MAASPPASPPAAPEPGRSGTTSVDSRSCRIRDLFRRRALLRREDVGGLEEARVDVARHVERDEERMRDGFRGADAAVGRRHAAHEDDDPLGSLGHCCRDELADAAARRAERVVPLRPARKREPARLRRLDQSGAVLVEPPRSFDRLAERPGHDSPPVAAAEHVERPLAAVRERQLDRAPAGSLGARGDRGRGLSRRQGAAELVGR